MTNQPFLIQLYIAVYREKAAFYPDPTDYPWVSEDVYSLRIKICIERDCLAVARSQIILRAS